MSFKKRLENVSLVVGNRYAILGMRLVLGAVFILAASGKLPEQAEFVHVVTSLGLLPFKFAQAYGTILPWLELTVGACLMVGLLCRIAAGASILMVTSFIVANGTGVFSYEFCPSCYPAPILLRTSDALVVDVAMVAISLPVLLYGAGFLSLDLLIWAKLKKH
jgi:uncharacterized membrane protein YphA (DoxX/SURF4 family)